MRVDSLLTLKGSRRSWSIGVEGMENSKPDSDDPWYDKRIRDLELEGWDIHSIESYVEKDVSLASERLVYVDYAVELAQELLERTGYLGEAVDERSLEQSHVWEQELRDPMNAERIHEEYRAWAKEWRPWELELNTGAAAWQTAGLEEEHAALLARFDALDASSLPLARLLSPLLSDPEETEEIHRSLRDLEDDEVRQRTAIRNAASMLRESGFDVSQIESMPILEGLDWITQMHEYHDVHEELRLLILEQISVFDPALAQHHEGRRRELLDTHSLEELRKFRLQMDSIADNLHQRLARLNDLLNEWRGRGIQFPHSDSVRTSELLEWETNLPEIEATLNLHFQALGRWKSIVRTWPDEESAGAEYAGVLEQTETFIDHVDHLEQKWKQFEIEALMLIEKYEQMGMAMGDWAEEVQKDPRSTLNQLKKNAHKFELRFQCIEKLAKMDTSFEGKETVDERIGLLKELDVDLEILEDTLQLVDKMSRRGARHRRMLEQDWRQLVAEGKASDSVATSSLTLAEFEKEVAHVRQFGSSSLASGLGGSIVSGEIHQRLIRRTQQELVILQSAGWNVHQLLTDVESDPVTVAQKINAFRAYVASYASQSQRLARLPWHRDVTLALELQQQIRDPTQLSSVFGNISSLARHLSTRDSEDEHYVFDAWTPQPARQTLVPVPENTRRQTMVPKDALGDAYEAMLEAVEDAAATATTADVAEKEVKIQPASRVLHDVEKEDTKVDTILSETTEDVERKAPSPRMEREDTVKPVQHQKPAVDLKATTTPPAVYENIVALLQALNLNTYADDMLLNGADALPNIRRGLAKQVGITPRDTRIDRMLRLALRLLPQNNELDEAKAKMLLHMAENTKSIQKWMRSRLEHRHSGSTDQFLDDALNLGMALKRIPGPGYPVPLVADTYDLPDANDIEGLNQEVLKLVKHLNLSTAGGIAG